MDFLYKLIYNEFIDHYRKIKLLTPLEEEHIKQLNTIVSEQKASEIDRLVELVKQEIEIQLNLLPRKEIAEKAMDNSRMIFFETNEESIDFINHYGPEHYIICVKEEQLYIDQITNAGSVFIGNYTPESAGDYASGTNHTLPTNGYTKQYSGVNLDSFLKQMTFQKISKKGIQNLGPSIELMAEAEGLQAHKNAVSLRLNDLNQ